MYACTSSGRIELQMTKAQAARCSHSGPCDADVLTLSQVPAVRRQLAKIDPALLRAELREISDWSDTELADHEQNLQRLLWCLANDITDGAFS